MSLRPSSNLLKSRNLLKGSRHSISWRLRIQGKNMIKQTYLEPNQKRTLTKEQIEKMTPLDLYLAAYECQFIDDPDWTYLMALHLMRILYRLIDNNNLDFASLNLDVKKTEMGTAIFKRYFDEKTEHGAK